MPETGPIICNAGPLIALSMIDRLSLLRELYSRILVPEAVYREVVDEGVGRVGARQIAAADWLERTPDLVAPDPFLTMELGAGEAAVLTLAARRNASEVLIDERKARRIAEVAYGLKPKGTAGILVTAKRRGLLDEVRPSLEDMARRGYYLSARLINRACREVGE